MKIPFLDIKRQQSSIQEELNAVAQDVIQGGWFIGGEYVDRFEKDFAKYNGIDHCVSCGNGTDALELILRGLDIGQGDEVIIPSFTWVSDAEVIKAVGAEIVFADIEAESFNISAETIAPCITPGTKAIIVVHLYGIPCDMEPILALAKKHSIKVIEDCAHAHGAIYKGKKVGSWGDASAFSFYPTKNLGALGDGGAVLTHDHKLAEKISLLSNHGQVQRDEHVMIGRNSRLDTLQAAFLSVKLKYLDEWNEERRRLAQIYLEGLKGADIILPSNDIERVFHLFVIRTKKRDALKNFLFEQGIETAIHYPKAIHQIDAYQTDITLLNSEKAVEEVLSLPLYRGLSEEEVSKVVDEICLFFDTIS